MNKNLLYSCTALLFTLCSSLLMAQTMDHSAHTQMAEEADSEIMETAGEMGASMPMNADSAMDMDMSMEADVEIPVEMPMEMDMPMGMDMGMDMSMDIDMFGLVMNANHNTLPQDCVSLGPDIAITVYAGTEFAEDFPGTIFGLSEHEYRVEPCSRITVTFINNDNIRHQWMVHGLPKYLYPQGMFHMEAAGGHQRTGTFIVPSDSKTYLVHCDMAQHMEKGMKAQLLVGGGNGDLWSVPGITANYNSTDSLSFPALFVVLATALSGFLGLGLLLRKKAHKKQ